MINTLSCFPPQPRARPRRGEFYEESARLISKVRTIAAFSYRRSLGLPFIYPDPKLPLLRELPAHDVLDAVPAVHRHAGGEDALNLIFILHGDHEQNCSTSTVRVVGSAQANLFASCAAAVCALWGPLHGGANVEVDGDARADPQGRHVAPGAASPRPRTRPIPSSSIGFGHRVYQNYDPRARSSKRPATRCSPRSNGKDPLLDIARKLEELALADPYFVDRKLYPNVDFYSGILLRAMGIPTNMFTVCSPSAGCRAGSPSGRSSTTIRRARSSARGRSTSAPPDGLRADGAAEVKLNLGEPAAICGSFQDPNEAIAVGRN